MDLYAFLAIEYLTKTVMHLPCFFVCRFYVLKSEIGLTEFSVGLVFAFYKLMKISADLFIALNFYKHCKLPPLELLTSLYHAKRR